MQNVIFQNTKKTWKDAANVCASTGGVLESNVTFLRDLHEFKIADDDVWIGKFRTLINWTYIRGLFIYDLCNRMEILGKPQQAAAKKQCITTQVIRIIHIGSYLKHRQRNFQISANNADFL